MPERDPLDPALLVVEGRKERISQVVAQRTRTLTVVLDRLEDNFNMGAVVRTCEALGIQEVHVVRNPEGPWKPSAKISQGCDKWLDIVIHPDFAACRDHLLPRGFELWVSAAREGGQSLFDLRFDHQVALVFGNERFGVSEEVLASAKGTFWIPMLGFTRSLNVSAAVSASVSRAICWRLEHLGRAGDLSAEQAQALELRFLQLSVKQGHRIYHPGGE